MEPKQRKSRRKTKAQTTIVAPEETTEMLKIAAMLERLAAEIRKLLLQRDG